MDSSPTQDPIAELVTNYHELNSSIIEELHEEPSPLEFMRYVARNTPFVVRGAARDWPAMRLWTLDFLKSVMGDQEVNVAVTPYGNADAPTPYTPPNSSSPPTLVFAKPHYELQPFTHFLSRVTAQELAPSKGQEILYSQTQNDNLRSGEFAPLFSLNHVPTQIPWARIALCPKPARDLSSSWGSDYEDEPKLGPDAVNLWIGTSKSVTALHRDNYENVYVQVAGEKHFVLLPPWDAACVNEQPLRPARYRRRENDGKLELVLDKDIGEGDEPVPFATWDPDKPEVNATKYSRLARPMRVTLNKGDMLYMPAMWYHKVSQSAGPEGVCIAVNYWYDMDFTGPLFPLGAFVRSVSSQKSSYTTA